MKIIIGLLLISCVLSAGLEQQEDLSRLQGLIDSHNLPVLTRNQFYSSMKEHSLSMVAFYDYNDVTTKDIAFFKEMLIAVDKLKKEGKDCFFGFYNDSLDSHMEDQYFLHYHTLPKVKVFYKGEALTYNGGNRHMHVVSYVKRILRETKLQSLHVTSGDQLENLTKQVDIMSVYVGNLESGNYKEYLETMKVFSTKALFTNSNDSEVIEKLLNKTNEWIPEEKDKVKINDLKDEVFIVNTEYLSDMNGIRRLSYDQHNPALQLQKSDLIAEFNAINEFKILTLTSEIADIHNNKKENWCFMLERESDVISDSMERAFSDHCKKKRNSLKCYFQDHTAEETKHIWAIIFGAQLIGKPQVFYLKPKLQDVQPVKYMYSQMPSDTDAKTGLATFFTSINEGSWPSMLKTETGLTTVNWNELITGASAATLTEIQRNDPEEDVLLYIYKNDCTYCKEFAPIYEETAQLLKDKYPSVKIRFAKIDGILNDVPDYTIKGYPAFLAYFKDNKENYVELDMPRNTKDLLLYLKRFLPSWRDADLIDL